MSVAAPDPTLVATAEEWLGHGLNGIGNAGDVRGKKVRTYSSERFSHDFKGYEAARVRFGKGFGESLVEAPDGKRGIIGIVAETDHCGERCLLCEVFDLATGSSVVVVQPFRKSLLKRKAVGSPTVLGTAEPLPYTPTPPGLKEMIARLKALADEQIEARRGEIDGAGIDMKAYSSKRGGDDVLWDFNLAPHRGGTMLEVWCKHFWAGEEALIADQEFSAWLAEHVDLALGL